MAWQLREEGGGEACQREGEKERGGEKTSEGEEVSRAAARSKDVTLRLQIHALEVSVREGHSHLG